jgi:hypothetical protein
MLIFWWQGKGYFTFLIGLASLAAFGVLQTVAKPYVPDEPWYWGLAFGIAAVLNWMKGSALNQKRIERRQATTIRSRLFYNAVHRSMSLPMETFSIVFGLIGLVLVVQNLRAI